MGFRSVCRPHKMTLCWLRLNFTDCNFQICGKNKALVHLDMIVVKTQHVFYEGKELDQTLRYCKGGQK